MKKNRPIVFGIATALTLGVMMAAGQQPAPPRYVDLEVVVDSHGDVRYFRMTESGEVQSWNDRYDWVALK